MSLPQGQSQLSPALLRKGVGAFSVAQPKNAPVESARKTTGHHFAPTAKPKNASNQPVLKPTGSARGPEDLRRGSSGDGQVKGSTPYSQEVCQLLIGSN